jgi:peptidoglycan-associated lipoprotein
MNRQKIIDMKPTTLPKLLTLAVVLSIAAIGCKKTPENPTAIPGARTEKPTEPPPAPPIVPPEQAGGTNTLVPLGGREQHVGWIENGDIFKAYTVHFDFDSSMLKAGEKSKVEAVANQLKSNPTTAVRVEGNCDERGTEEYNRSLGERRALALREELIRLGIEPARVDTISYGEDRPVAQGHDESAWKQNRRGDFVQLTPPAKQ